MPVRFYQGEETSPPCAATVLCIRTRLPLSWHRKEGLEMEYVAFTYLFIISFLSSPLYSLIRDSLHFLFYLLVLHFPHLFFSTELFPLGLFFLFIFFTAFLKQKMHQGCFKFGLNFKTQSLWGTSGPRRIHLVRRMGRCVWLVRQPWQAEQVLSPTRTRTK